jgi:hypothetical protein
LMGDTKELEDRRDMEKMSSRSKSKERSKTIAIKTAVRHKPFAAMKVSPSLQKRKGLTFLSCQCNLEREMQHPAC